MYKIGQLYCNNKLYSKAIPFLEKVPDNDEFNSKILFLAHCYYYNNQIKKSKEYFKILLNKYPSNKYIRKYYTNINRKINFNLGITIMDKFDYISPFIFSSKKPKREYNFKPIIFAAIIALIIPLSYQFTSSNAKFNSDEKLKSSSGKLETNLDKLEKSISSKAANFKESPINSTILLKLSNTSKLPFFIVTDNNGNQVYLTENEYNPSNYIGNTVKKFYCSKDENGIVIIYVYTDSEKYNYTLNNYIKGTVIQFPSQLVKPITDQLNKLYGQDKYTMISDKYFNGDQLLYCK
jgi:tetratricopeptide (TPR) repeat protein